MEEKPKLKFITSRLIIFLVTYFSLVVLLVPLSIHRNKGQLFSIGDYLLWGGAFVASVGWLFIDRDSTWFRTFVVGYDGKNIRTLKRDKPFESALFMIIIAGAAVSFTGFLVMKFILF